MSQVPRAAREGRRAASGDSRSPTESRRTPRLDRGITLSGLRTFVAVVQAQGLSGAARLLGVTQPSVSIQLAALERACGVLLCHRKPDFSLTQAGTDVFVRARLILARVDEFESALIDLQSAAGRLNVGISTPHLAMPLLARFREAEPDIHLNMMMGNTGTLLDDVTRCKVDVAIMTLLQPPAHLMCLRIASPRLAICLRSDDPLANSRSLPPRALAPLRVIAREPGSQTRALFEETLARAGVTPHQWIEIGNREAMKEAVAAGLGAGMLFDHENGQDPRFALVPLEDVPQQPGVFAVALPESEGIPAVHSLLEHLKHWVQKPVAGRHPAGKQRISKR